MEDVYLVGAGMTPFGKFLDKSVKDLTREAVDEANPKSELRPSPPRHTMLSMSA